MGGAALPGTVRAVAVASPPPDDRRGAARHSACPHLRFLQTGGTALAEAAQGGEVPLATVQRARRRREPSGDQRRGIAAAKGGTTRQPAARAAGKGGGFVHLVPRTAVPQGCKGDTARMQRVAYLLGARVINSSAQLSEKGQVSKTGE
ncbi:hypothetical protein BS78_07G119400 [Paspalum vaginatum]|nr:hypothetical protein BS78_07G119400 [Paspalum vaginatum]KAJ1268212.1 hypothetical protein BS78_07G119400 [Paspalum vaginatum]